MQDINLVNQIVSKHAATGTDLSLISVFYSHATIGWLLKYFVTVAPQKCSYKENVANVVEIFHGNFQQIPSSDTPRNTMKPQTLFRMKQKPNKHSIVLVS